MAVFHGADDELASEIVAHFTTEMHRADFARIRRVAATLIANVERDIRDGLRRRWTEAARRQDLPADDTPLHDHVGSWRGRSLRAEVDATPVIIRDVLARVSADAANIVCAVAVFGETQREVADRLGLGHDVVRKRYQRSLRRLRETLEADVHLVPIHHQYPRFNFK